jgi:hypothetical protein
VVNSLPLGWSWCTQSRRRSVKNMAVINDEDVIKHLTLYQLWCRIASTSTSPPAPTHHPPHPHAHTHTHTHTHTTLAHTPHLTSPMAVCFLSIISLLFFIFSSGDHPLLAFIFTVKLITFVLLMACHCMSITDLYMYHVQHYQR